MAPSDRWIPSSPPLSSGKTLVSLHGLIHRPVPKAGPAFHEPQLLLTCDGPDVAVPKTASCSWHLEGVLYWDTRKIKRKRLFKVLGFKNKGTLLGTPNREPPKYSRNIVEYKGPSRHIPTIFLGFPVWDSL